MRTTITSSKLAIVLGSIALLVGCGSKNTPSTMSGIEIRKIGALEYGVLDGNIANFEGGMSGTGTTVFKNPLPHEDNHFSLIVQLQEKGKITVIANSDNKLQSGVSLSLTQSGGAIVATMKAGTDVADVSSFFSGIDATKAFSVEFEVHPHGHLILGSGEQTEEHDFTTRPTGKFWGLALENAAVTSAAISAAQGA